MVAWCCLYISDEVLCTAYTHRVVKASHYGQRIVLTPSVLIKVWVNISRHREIPTTHCNLTAQAWSIKYIGQT